MKKKYNLLGNFLSASNSGIIFKRPFRFIYLLLGISLAVLSVIMLYYAVQTQTAYHKRENSRVVMNKYRWTFAENKRNYEEAEKTYRSLNEQYYSLANEHSEYERKMQYYLYYTDYYVQEIRAARANMKRLSGLIQQKWSELNTATSYLEKIRPQFESAKAKMDFHESNFNRAAANYDRVSPRGAFHETQSKLLSIIGLIMFFCLAIGMGIWFMLLFIRRSRSLENSVKNTDELTAIPVLSHFIRTLGEAAGSYIALFGLGSYLIALIGNLSFGSYGMQSIFSESLSEMYGEPMIIIIIPFAIITVAFFILFLSRLLAEFLQSVANIANNTHQLVMMQTPSEAVAETPATVDKANPEQETIE